MKAKDILRVIDKVDYRELLKALIMFETGHDEKYANDIIDKFMADENSTTLFDLKEYI